MAYYPSTPPNRVGNTIFRLFLVQAVITFLFTLIDLGVNANGAVAAIQILAALATVGVGLYVRAKQTPQTWAIALGFEIVYIVLGVGVLVTAHSYMVGTIVAVGNIVRLNRLKPFFGQGGAPIPPGGYGPTYGAAPYGQPGQFPQGQPGQFGQPGQYGQFPQGQQQNQPGQAPYGASETGQPPFGQPPA